MIVLLDNQDSFVYNLVDALAGCAGAEEMVVYRNTVPADTVLGANGGDAPNLTALTPPPADPQPP